jgi:hypothetical protein
MDRFADAEEEDTLSLNKSQPPDLLCPKANKQYTGINCRKPPTTDSIMGRSADAEEEDALSLNKRQASPPPDRLCPKAKKKFHWHKLYIPHCR